MKKEMECIEHLLSAEGHCRHAHAGGFTIAIIFGNVQLLFRICSTSRVVESTAGKYPRELDEEAYGGDRKREAHIKFTVAAYILQSRLAENACSKRSNLEIGAILNHGSQNGLVKKAARVDEDGKC